MNQKLLKQIGLCLCVGVLAAATAGCDSARKAFGGAKQAPDEFVVYKRPPLSLPPGYGLRPPAPGAARPQKVSPIDEAKSAMLGRKPAAVAAQSKQAGGTSRGLQSLLNQTGAHTAEPGIRRIVNEESSALAEEDQIFVNKLIFWVDDKSKKGTVVDPKKETQRIMSNQALGKPITEGETPQIKRKPKRKGLLDF